MTKTSWASSWPPSWAASWTFWLVALAAVLCNVAAQISMQRAHIHSLQQPHLWWQPAVAVALACYGLSFVLTAWLYARAPLSVLTPTMAAVIFMLLLAYDGWWLGQGIAPERWLGVALLCLGIYFLHRPHAG